MIQLLYFARLRETLGRSSEQLDWQPEFAQVADLLNHLRQRGTPWQEALAPGQNFRVAINQDMAQADSPLVDGDEVALFPPVTGG